MFESYIFIYHLIIFLKPWFSVFLTLWLYFSAGVGDRQPADSVRAVPVCVHSIGEVSDHECHP